VGGCQTGGAGSSYNFLFTKREVFGGTKIQFFEFGVKYLNFGATYLSFGATYLSFGTIYLNLGAVYLNFGEKTLQSLCEGYGVGVGGSPGTTGRFRFLSQGKRFRPPLDLPSPFYPPPPFLRHPPKRQRYSTTLGCWTLGRARPTGSDQSSTARNGEYLGSHQRGLPSEP